MRRISSLDRPRAAAAAALLGILLAHPGTSPASELKKAAAPHRHVLFAPSGYDKVVILENKGRRFKYYGFSLSTPLSIKVKGPTELDILVRLLYDVKMKGAQDYSLEITEPGLLGRRNTVGAHRLKARKSVRSTIKGRADIVPSKADKFTLVVPEGEHDYTVRLKAVAASSAIIRILIPRRDVQTVKKEKRR